MSSEIDAVMQEAAHDATEALEGDTRLGFLKKAGLAGGGLVGGGALLSALTPAAAMAAGKGRPPAKFGKGDIGILNYALTLEYLEAAFYNEATANNKKKTFLKGAQEQAFLKRVDRRRERPRRLPQEGARQQGGEGPEGRLRQHHRQRVGLHQDRGGAGEHRRRRLLGPGAEHRQPGLRGGGALDPGRSRRGTPRSPACC